jgi:hypothetical protein
LSGPYTYRKPIGAITSMGYLASEVLAARDGATLPKSRIGAMRTPKKPVKDIRNGEIRKAATLRVLQ